MAPLCSLCSSLVPACSAPRRRSSLAAASFLSTSAQLFPVTSGDHVAFSSRPSCSSSRMLLGAVSRRHGTVVLIGREFRSRPTAGRPERSIRSSNSSADWLPVTTPAGTCGPQTDTRQSTIAATLPANVPLGSPVSVLYRHRFDWRAIVLVVTRCPTRPKSRVSRQQIPGQRCTPAVCWPARGWRSPPRPRGRSRIGALRGVSAGSHRLLTTEHLLRSRARLLLNDALHRHSTFLT
jgi:hypothetical protein